MSDADRSVIGGRYQIIASLGKGGMGLVYKAYDPVLDRTVALKKMIATVVDSEEGRQRFYIEARAAARLNHPNIVTIHELEEYSGDIYIVMELLDGVSLASIMRQRVQMPLAGYLTIIAQVADGLHYAHKRAIVHRDVKPPNLVLTTTGNVKILDFGIARLASNEITRKGKLLGTPHYMAPEQVLEQSVDARADLFSLGAVAYELVTGIKPFAGDSIPALLMQITSTPHRPVREVAPETEPALAAVIDRLLAKNREERFLTGLEVESALDLIGEIDRIDIVAEAVSAVMGPSGDATIYAPIGSTPAAGAPTPPSAAPTPPAVTPPLTVTPQVASPLIVPPPSLAPPSFATTSSASSVAEDVTVSLSAVPSAKADSPAPPQLPRDEDAASPWGFSPIASKPFTPRDAASVWGQPSKPQDIAPREEPALKTPPLPVTGTAPGSIVTPPSPVPSAPAGAMPSPAASPRAGAPSASGDISTGKGSSFELPDTLAAVPPLTANGAAAASGTAAPAPATSTSIPAVPHAPAVPPSSSSAPPAAAPSAASASASVSPSAAKTPGASGPRGFVNPGVPPPRHRSGTGAAVMVVGLLLLPAVVATGWWAFNSMRGPNQGTTATDTTSPSTVKDADPSAQKPAESSAAATDSVKPPETPTDPASQSQEPAQTPPAADPTAATAANAATATPPEAADPAKPSDASQTADANRANASQAVDATRPAQANQATNQPPASQPAANQPPANQSNASQVAEASRTVQPNQPGANQATANRPAATQPTSNPANATPANANQREATPATVDARNARNVSPTARDATREPVRDAVTDRTRETAPETVVRDPTAESSRAPGRSAPAREPAENRREPAPPVRDDPPPTDPSREPSTPADTRSLDYGSLGAFRGGSRSTGSASSVYTESPSTAAAVARITYALDAYGDAIAARDLDALRDVRSPVTPAEAALLKEGRTTVRFSDLDVSLTGSVARVRCRRALVTNGKTVSSGPAVVSLTRRPEGWVITEIR